MTTAYRLIVTACLWLNVHAVALASEPDHPKPIPQSRRAMLEALDKLKSRSARLPLPDPQPAVSNNESSDQPSSPASQSRSLGVVNNGRMRTLYLPEQLSRRANPTSPSKPDSDASYQFATELFWIVSRVNNCHYCLGHQEDKLLKLGVPESNLLLLDTDWSDFSAKHQAALHFAKILTHQPHRISRADIDELLVHYSKDEALEIAFLIGRYNATNRWTDSLGIPQETHRRFDTKLGQSEIDLPSIVTVETASERPFINDFQQWKNRLTKETQNVQPSIEEALATNKAAGPDWADQVRAARHVGSLDPVLKAKIAFVAACEDQAWAMQAEGLQRLAAYDIDPEAAYALRASIESDQPIDSASVALKFALKLTSQPQSMTDRDIANLEPHFDEHEIAEIVYHTGLAAMLNRLSIVATIVSSP